MSEKKIGFWHAVSLVTGNMIGSGIFLLPASLAAFGFYSLWGWLISSTGAILLALIFARLSRQYPLTGGLYAYTQKAFGSFPGFIVAWGYWICIWTGNAAIVIAFVSSLSPFFPSIANNINLSAGLCVTTVWLITLLNMKGVREAAQFQVVTTVLKVLPLIAIGTFGYFYFHSENFFNPTEDVKIPGVFFQTAALTLWSFLGVESATIPASSIINPRKNIGRATITGTLFAAMVYILACTAVIGIVPGSIMTNSAAPFADAAMQMGGKTFYYITSAAAAIACVGTLNGWILLQGQLPAAAANDKIFPAIFALKNKNEVPYASLIISSILITMMIFLNYSGSLQQQFNNMILLSTLSTLIPYAFCSVAELVILKRGGEKIMWSNHKKLILLSAMGFLFTAGAIAGTGMKTISYGLLLLAAGVPVFIYQVKRKEKRFTPDV